MNAPNPVHPSDRTLNEYGLGKLDDASASTVHEHLEGCPDCRQRLSGFTPDSFLGRFREANRATDRSIPGGTMDVGTLSDFQARPTSPPPSNDTLPAGLANHPDYEIKRELGRGGMGVVYLAHNTMMGRDEVLKVMGRHIMERPGVLERFQREIRAVAKFRHPNIVAAYHAFRIEGGLVFSMEYVEGLDLSRLVQAKGPLSVTHAAYFVHQAALGLQHAHEKGLIHRDIKPHNLMLTHDGKARLIKVLDFGLAKATREEKVDGGLTSEGQALGTPDYIAPEQIVNALDVDIRADLYSLGGTLFYLLTGRPPFQCNSLYDIYQAHMSRDAEPLNLIRPEVPAELAALVAKMMAKDPRRRFQAPIEVAQALTPYFKPGTSRSVIPSQVSQAGPSRAPSRSAEPPTSTPPGRASTPTTRHASRPGLGVFEETPPASGALAAEPVPAEGAARRPRWTWPLVSAAVLFLGAALAFAMGGLKVKTPLGTIVLENLPANAEVFVDGGKVSVIPGDGGDPLEITVRPGDYTARASAGKPHSLEVRRGKEVLTSRDLTIEAGGQGPLKIRLDDMEQAKAGVGGMMGSPANNPTLGMGDMMGPASRPQAPPTVLNAASSTLPRAKIGPGAWTIEGDELVQSNDQVGSWMTFGDPEWSEYDFTLEGKRVGNGNGLLVTFHNLPSQGWALFGLGVYENTGCQMYFLADGKGSRASDNNADNWSGRRVSEGEWHSIKVEVRKSNYKCYLDGGLLFEGSKSSLTHGRVGFHAPKNKARFRNIKVTAPGGMVLFEGLPDLYPAIKPTSPARVSKSPPDRLFNGKDLTGWRDLLPNGSEWNVVDGLLEGRGNQNNSGTGGPAVLVLKRDDLKDFRLRAKVRHRAEGFGWIELRRSSGSDLMSGYVVATGTWPMGHYIFPTGSIQSITDYRYTTDRGYFFGAQPTPIQVDEWADLTIDVHENTIVTTLNGKTVGEYTDPDGKHPVGSIALGCAWDTVVQYQSITLESITPESAPAKSLSDLDRVATGRWTRIVDASTALPDQAKMKMNDGILELNACVLRLPGIDARNLILRAKVLTYSGMHWGNVSLGVRSKDSEGYTGFYNGSALGGDYFGIGKLGRPYRDLATDHVGRKFEPDQYVEMALAAIDDTMTLYVDGRRAITVKNDELDRGSVRLASHKGLSFFKDVECQILDTPPAASQESKKP